MCLRESEQEVKMTAISVIVPTHNSKKYIRECMDSIVRQTMSNIEIICVDSSMDGTTEILYAYQKSDERIRVLEDKNASYGHKINVGIQQADGKYIAIVESDDYIADNMMESLFRVADQNKVDFVKSNYKSFVDIDGERWFTCSNIAEEEQYHRVINLKKEKTVLPVVGYNIWTGLYSKSFLNEKKIFMHESAGAAYQDASFAGLTAMLAERVYFLKETYYGYRRDNDGSSVKSDEKYMYIPHEFAWLRERMRCLECDTPENIELFKILKLRSYAWNYKRLSEVYREKLLNEISEDDLEDIDKSILDLDMPDKDRVLRIYRGDEEYIKQEREKEHKKRIIYEKLFNIFQKHNNIVLVCYGGYGQSIYRLMKLEGYDGNIVICDNNKKGNMSEDGKIKIADIEITVMHNIKAHYIIANKRQHDVLKEQLKRYGIEEKSIYVCSEIALGLEDLMWDFNRYFKEK